MSPRDEENRPGELSVGASEGQVRNSTSEVPSHRVGIGSRLHTEHRTRWIVGGVLLAVAGLVVIYVLPPGPGKIYPPCPFYALTGYHCPGCGTLRGLHAFMHGHPVDAFGYNPLSAALLPLLALLGVYRGIAWARRSAGGAEPWSTNRIPAAAVWGLFVVVVLFWILRNIPAYPFTLLAPN